MSFFDKIKEGLSKTRQSVSGQLDSMIKSFTKIDDELMEELLEALIVADMGVETSEEIVEALRGKIKQTGTTDPAQVKGLLKETIVEMLDGSRELKIASRPSVILMIGVNGVGKTTSIAKIAHMLKNSGKKVVLCAGDTFRAGAIAQLEVWAGRATVEIIKSSHGSDPAAVVFDAIAATRARDADILLCDTAGRLHNKKNLMDELAKIFRVIARELPEADVEVLLVLDATTGQNALRQAEEFKQAAPVTGIVLTKLDGTAKGGIVVPIFRRLGIPVKFVGVGEKMDDLQPFEPEAYVSALFD